MGSRLGVWRERRVPEFARFPEGILFLATRFTSQPDARFRQMQGP